MRAAGSMPSQCRRCGGALARKSLGAWGCASCGGLFFSGEDWDAVVDTVRTGGALDIATIVPPPPGAAKYDRLALVPCASCGALMDRAKFGARSAVTVDVCTRHGLWLDAGELVGILEFVRRLWKNHGSILSPDEARDQAAMREYHRVRMEQDKRKQDEIDEIEQDVAAITGTQNPFGK